MHISAKICEWQSFSRLHIPCCLRSTPSTIQPLRRHLCTSCEPFGSRNLCFNLWWRTCGCQDMCLYVGLNWWLLCTLYGLNNIISICKLSILIYKRCNWSLLFNKTLVIHWIICLLLFILHMLTPMSPTNVEGGTTPWLWSLNSDWDSVFHNNLSWELLQTYRYLI